nr:MAG TPA: DBF DBF zinc finger [Caudoviricetes sp.]
MYKVENLCKVKSYSVTTLDYMVIENGALVISEVGISNLKNKIGIPSNSTIVSVSVAQSAGYCEYCTYNYDSDTAHVGHIIPKNNPRTAAINVTYI